ncbi:hypothetical protein C0Q70_16121 [Pomacea canaliculata]|uniref:Uncharacterized protein n=1 Tax=Pomacea canaliculata TaxID=400727 RepID=A0A2T7NNY9_POMCA|nr:hypothetical protein C0Q70_16121 [Pomacea canaliculata]
MNLVSSHKATEPREVTTRSDTTISCQCHRQLPLSPGPDTLWLPVNFRPDPNLDRESGQYVVAASDGHRRLGEHVHVEYVSTRGRNP